MIRKLLCLLGYHKWNYIDKNPIPKPEKNETICWRALMQCPYCKKEVYLGMGCIL